MILEDAIKHIRNGDAVLFTGAGFSLDSRNRLDKNLPSANQLIEALTERLQLGEQITNIPDLPLAVEMAVEETSPFDVFEALKDILTARKMEGWQYDICELPWLRVYTTNFDNTLELARPNNRCIDFNSELVELDGGENIFLNGMISRTNAGNVFHKLRLNSSSYLNIKTESNRIFNKLQDDLERARCFVVLGYSLYDDDIKHLIYQSDHIREKTIFVSGKCNEILRRRIEKFGTDSNLTGKEFAQFISDHLSDTPSEPALPKNVTRIRDTRPETKNASIDDVANLFFYGDLQSDLISKQYQRPTSKYILERETPYFEPGTKTIVHSNLGNGKSVFLHTLPYIEPARNWFLSRGIVDENEIAAFMKGLNESDVMLFDEVDIGVLLRIFEQQFECAVVGSARTTTYEQFRSKFFDADKTNCIKEYSVNNLNTQEVESLCNLIEKHSLWPEQNLFSNPRGQKKHIIEKCNSEISLALLSLFDSPQITKRLEIFEKNFSTLQYEEKRFMFVEGFLQVISYAHQDNTSFRLLDFVPNNNLYKSDYLFEKMGLFFRFRSPVLSKYFFKNKVKDEEVAEYIFESAKFCDQRKHEWNECWDLFRRFMRYYNISQFISDEKVILDLYKRFQELDIAKRDPLFWIQYSISRIEDNEYGLSRRFIERSRSIVDFRNSKGHHFDPYQIDTHEAQYLLKGVANSRISTSLVDVFTKATKLLSGVYNRRPDDTLHLSHTTKIFIEAINAKNAEITPGDAAYIAASLRSFKTLFGNNNKAFGQDNHIDNIKRNCDLCLRILEGNQ